MYNGDMVTLNAHFDGKVIVPDEPTGLPAGTRLRVTLEPLDRAGSPGPGKLDLPLLTGVDPQVVRSIIEDPAFDLGNARIEQFLGSVIPENPQ